MITWIQILRASLRYHARSHLGVILGAAVGAAALIGALVVGESVRETLKARARERLGATALAVSSGDRLFRSELASGLMGRDTDLGSDHGHRRLVWGLGWPLQPTTVTALRLRGTVARQDGTARALEVQIHGVSSNFWSFSPKSAAIHAAMTRSAGGMRESVAWVADLAGRARPAAGKVRINRGLAALLRAGPGDALVLRFPKPSALSQDAVLTPRNESAAALRLEVEDVVEGGDFGDFALTAGAAPALNAFVDFDELARVAGVPGRANLLLVRDGFLAAAAGNWRTKLWAMAGPQGIAGVRGVLGRFAGGLMFQPAPTALLEEQMGPALERAWRLEDGQIGVRVIPAAEGRPELVEVASPRIFLDAPVVAAATAPDPRLPAADREERGWLTNGVRILTYLANGLRHGDRLVPYSMVTAAGAPWTPPGLADNEIVVNDWLARELAVEPGAELELTYFDPEAGARLVERTNRFRVHSVVPIAGWHADRTLMPEFPGLSKAESTKDWDAGFPLSHRIRDQDEAYWKKHRGTPKAWVTSAAGRRMWGNRFGEATAVRFVVPSGDHPEAFRQRLEANVRATLRPGDVGLALAPVRAQAMRAATSGQDFGGLFIGFSFFLVLSAMLLMALLFRFGLEQRLPEVGTWLALGFRPRQVRRLWLVEGVALAALGAAAGAAGGVAYARAMILGLSTLWRDAVGGAVLELHAGAASVIGGWILAVAVCAGAMFLALRREFGRPVRELLAGELGQGHAAGRGSGLGRWVAWAAIAGGIGLTGWALSRGEAANPAVFFGAGSLILMGGLMGFSDWLRRHGGSRPDAAAVVPLDGLGSLALRGTTRRASRSVTTAALLACGTFLVASLGAFRMDAGKGAEERGAGTGGFALIGKSALPISHDLNTPAGLEFFGLGSQDVPGVSFVSFRVREGDDASCLNLNRAQRPRILGVRPADLAGRRAFTFAKEAGGTEGGASGWERLALPPGGVVPRGADGVPEYPAIGDAASIQWALGSRVGGVIELTDERGAPFRLRLVGGVANSILQGSLVVDAAVFERLFPGESGYRWFLIDAPRDRVTPVSAILSRALQDVGLELVPAAVRLAQFHAVQNTYLSTFQVLGGLGLLLGSAGLGVVVLRNVLERRSELALLAAVGFEPPVIRRLVVSEHLALLAVGLGLGVLAAFVAVLPAFTGAGGARPPVSLAVTLAGVAVVGLITALAATRYSLRGRLLEALRGD